MKALPPTRHGRAAVISAALGLFLVGSNYCLIGALRGTPMPCTTIAGAVPVKSAPAAPLCPLHASKSGAKDSQSKTPGAAPCCVTLARVDAPDVQRLDTSSTPVVVLAVIAASLAIDPDEPTLHPLLLDAHPPAPAWDTHVHAGRAPPTLA